MARTLLQGGAARSTRYGHRGSLDNHSDMIQTAFSDDELRALSAVMPLTIAGRALGIGAAKSRELAERSEFPCPVLALGRKRVVGRASLFEVLGLDASVGRADGPRRSAMTFDDLLALPASFPIDVAGKALAMGCDKVAATAPRRAASHRGPCARREVDMHPAQELFAYLGLDPARVSAGNATAAEDLRASHPVSPQPDGS
jgi:hypothetical protein